MSSDAERRRERRKNEAKAQGRTYHPRPKRNYQGDVIDWTKSEPTTIKPVPYTIDTYSCLTPATFDTFLITLRKAGYAVEAIQDQVLVSSMTAVEKQIKSYKPWFPSLREYPVIKLTYPGEVAFEKYKLCRPTNKLDHDPIIDLAETVHSIAEAFGTTELKALADDLEADLESRVFKRVQETMDRINNAFVNLPPLASLKAGFCDEVLEQCYRRCVNPELALLKLKSQETWSAKVYGELMPILLEEIFERAKLGKQSMFLDLGSGVGNVVAYASLKTGCTSFGVEICSGPSTIAKTHLEQAAARGRVWGLQAGKMTVEEGDMLKSNMVNLTVAAADLILVNNKVFSQSFNALIKNMLVHMKRGAILVSLESFKSGGTRGRPSEDDFTRSMKETIFRYPPGSVSWTGAGGNYYWNEKVLISC